MLSRGNFYVRDTKWGAVAQVWPVKRGPPKTPYDFYKQKEFGIAARMAANPIDLDYGTAVEMVKGSTLVPRDFLLQCAYGRAYVIEQEDGFQWPNYRDMAPNPQYVLDLITTTVGTLIWRSDVGWVQIDPGNTGQLLTVTDDGPSWEDPTVPPGSGHVYVDVFTANGTWNKRLGAKAVDAWVIGAGAGAGSGRKNSNAASCSAGSGGGAGAITHTRFQAADLQLTEPVVVGLGGTGGAAQTTNTTNGLGGANGQTSSFSSNHTLVQAGGGTAGLGGTLAVANGGAAATLGRILGSPGAASGVGSAGTQPAGTAGPAPTGGGSGAGNVAVPTNRNGGNSGGGASTSGFSTAGRAGGIAATKTAAENGVTRGVELGAGLGGGGGWSASDGTAGDGGNGADGGGGGGGGGSSQNPNNSGKGGNGGKGLVVVITYL